jgi:hypothetical protein
VVLWADQRHPAAGARMARFRFARIRTASPGRWREGEGKHADD